MARRIFVTLFCSVYLIIFVSTSHGQDSKKITLPNGEMVWDLNGEWEALVENYGPSAHAGSYRQILKITQTGSSFVAVRMIDDPNNPKGSEAIRGELEKSGFKKLQIKTPMGAFDAKGKISDDGNKMEIDSADRVKLTATRK